MWFAAAGTNAIGRITPSGQVTEFPIPTPESIPNEITAGPDGNLWFTEEKADKIGRITPSGEITEFPLSGQCSECTAECTVNPECTVYGITAGPEGSLWFTESLFGFGEINRITPAGQIKRVKQTAGAPTGITTGPDGNLWFSVMEEEILEPSAAGRIGRLTPSGRLTEFPPIPSGPTDANPEGITTGPDGNLWFADLTYARIGRITLSGQLVEFRVPSGNVSGSITAGPDGNLWFSAQGAVLRKGSRGAIDRITPQGLITVFPIKAFGSNWVAAGPDGNIWFTESPPSGISRITPGLPGVEVTSADTQIKRGLAKLALACGGGNPGSTCRGELTLNVVRPQPSPRRGKRARRQVPATTETRLSQSRYKLFLRGRRLDRAAAEPQSTRGTCPPPLSLASCAGCRCSGQ